MKLTEVKLKQLIRESLGQSQHFNKLITLMGTEEGFNQAQSLFEMIESSLPSKEAAELKRYFEAVDLAKELYTLKLQEDEKRENFKKIEAKLGGAPINTEADRAYSELIQASNDRYRKRGKFNTKMSVILKYGDRSIFHVVKSMTEKILKGTI